MNHDARHRLEELLGREITAAQSLAQILAAERAALTGDSSEVVKELAAEKIGLLKLGNQGVVAIGSCNLHAFSLTGNTEMNAAIWDPKVVRALRCELLAEHLDRDTAGIDDRAALRLYGEIARENRRRREAGDRKWQGLAFSLDPSTYGR